MGGTCEDGLYFLCRHDDVEIVGKSGGCTCEGGLYFLCRHEDVDLKSSFF